MADLSKIPLSRIQDFSDIIDNKQNKLVAGTNITIDNTNPDSPVISSTGGGGGRGIGEVFYSQSSLAKDNSGALPLFTGETIASANTIYPEFYNWILAHTEVQCTAEEYESALSTYGECAKYATKSQTTSYEWNGATSSMAVSGVYTKSNTPTIGDIIYNDEACSTPSVGSDGVTRTVLTIVSTDPYTFTADFGFQDEQGNPRFTLVTSHTVTITDGSLRLPLIKNYIKAANTEDGITQALGGGFTGVPDYSAGYTITSGTALTEDALVTCTGSPGGYGTINMSVDGKEVYRGGVSENTARPRAGNIYAAKGSVITSSAGTLTVYPLKARQTGYVTLYPWVCAYNAAVPASTAQAAQFQQGLSGKADTDLSNVSANGIATAVSWGMPDYSAVVTCTSPFTAPSNGFISYNNAGTANCTVNGNTVYLGGNDASNEGNVILYLSKNDIIVFTSDSGTPCFVPCKGVN